MTDQTSTNLAALARERILLLDGAMGTMIQREKLTESDFRGDAFASHPGDLRGANDLLCLTQPDIIRRIHRAYLDAGSDIIETNTFNATSVSLADYGLEQYVYEINVAAARLAREAADEVMSDERGRLCFVAGAMGPTSRTASLSPDVNNPAFRAVTFDDLVGAYYEQARGLLDGGADILLPETIFDTLNAKAALFAIEKLFGERGSRVPVMISVTITDASGRTLSGQTVDAFWYSVQHAAPFSVGINCALGAREMRPHVDALSSIAPVFVSCYPNAGLPNALGGYDETPEQMAAELAEYAANGWLNIVGGCCGTTPEHIRAFRAAVRGASPRIVPEKDPYTILSGLEPLVIRPDSNFIVVGERTNVTGSPRFAKLVQAGDLEGALKVARQQIDGGANILDVNMDEGLLDSEKVMTEFLHLIGSEPEISRIPIMVDSSRWSVLEAGLKCLQGRSVVNSISLKEGELVFREQATAIKRYGAAAVVMAFDEQGQADTVERKLEVLSRAYVILTVEVGFDPSEIIFDPAVLTVGTGMEEHAGYGVAFIEATRELKRRFPRAKVSGGISNVSFSFRGNNAVREAMHAAFLYHAIAAGLDMGIVNAGQLAIYEEIPHDLLERVEDVLLNRRGDATERLLEFAATYHAERQTHEREQAWRHVPVDERLAHAVVHGVVDHLDEDLTEARTIYPAPLQIIEGPLMSGMNVVGELFGSGKMFLPQVVKSARVMKKAVAWLLPYMPKIEGETRKNGRIVVATVKGDVHDIGKNIVGVVLGCNSYDVVDLGVMVSAERIVKAVVEEKADIVGLSGLITPSLDEMVHVATELKRHGIKIPLLIGGATTSKLHTALRIAPAYEGPTVHVNDAARCVPVAAALLSADNRDALVRDLASEQEKLRDAYHSRESQQQLIPISAARENRLKLDWSAYRPPKPSFTGVNVLSSVPLEEIIPFIDWSPLFHAWEMRGVYPAIFDDPIVGARARELFDDAEEMLARIVAERAFTARAVYGLFAANSSGDDIVLYPDENRSRSLAVVHTLRQQMQKREGDRHLALSDFVAPAGSEDYFGGFVVSTGFGVEAVAEAFKKDHDDYSAIMAKALADRLAEGLAEMLHKRVRDEWGFGREEILTAQELISEKYRGIRPAPGYPACPDHTEKRTLFSLLAATKATEIELTESCAMSPASSVAGWYFSHPESRYFAVGKIGRDQVVDYAKRKGMSVGEAERWLAPILSYSPR